MRRLLTEFSEFFDDVIDGGLWLEWHVVQVATAEFQRREVVAGIGCDFAMHPGFRLFRKRRCEAYSFAIAPIVFGVDRLIAGRQ
jgi:hypothetical protein